MARSNHVGGVNTVFADASVQYVNDSIALDVWQQLGTINGAEIVDKSAY
jgi:prepilin-type processing-associated H-X9-DG protein